MQLQVTFLAPLTFFNFQYTFFNEIFPIEKRKFSRLNYGQMRGTMFLRNKSTGGRSGNWVHLENEFDEVLIEDY